MLGDDNKFVFALTKDLDRGIICLFDQEGDLLVDFSRRLRADGITAIRFQFERHVPEGTHTKFTDHTTSYIRDILDVLTSACGDITKNKLFSGASTHCTRHLCQQF